MEPKARYTIVGAVLVIAAIALAGALLWFSKFGGGGQQRNFVIYLHENSAAGLQKDGAVTMKGIRIGTVRSLEISARNIESVRVAIQVDQSTPIKTDTRAVVQRNLLTGLASIDLMGSSQAAKPLVDHGPFEDVPVIPEGTDGISKLQEGIPDVLMKAQKLLDNAARMVSEENQLALSATMSNIREITESLANQREDLAGAVASIHEMSERLAELATSLQSQGTQTLTAVQELAQAARNQTEMVGPALMSSATKMARTAEVLQEPHSVLFGTNKNARGPGE